MNSLAKGVLSHPSDLGGPLATDIVQANSRGCVFSLCATRYAMLLPSTHSRIKLMRHPLDDATFADRDHIKDELGIKTIIDLRTK